MGWFSNLFKKETPTQTKYAEVMSGYAPIFSQFGTDIYASDVVQQAISCIVSEMKKLRPEHIREKDNDIIPMASSIQAVLNRPNPRMTTSEFLEKVTWLLFLNYNAFILPVYHVWTENGVEKRKYEALYPITPSQVDFIEDASNRLFVRFRFNNGQEYTVRYSDVIHLKYRYSVNDFMGGNAQGQPDNDALLKTLNLNHKLLEGVAKAMNASYAVNAVVKHNTMLDDGKVSKSLKEFEKKLKNSESGILGLDIKNEFVPIKRETQLVHADTLKFIDEKILRHFGVPLPILTGDYTKEQYEAFYQKTLEPLIISYTQAFTYTLFTDGELSHHNKIMFFAKDLIFMSTDQKLQMINEFAPTGTLYENEKRVTMGLRPDKALVGKRYMSLNWIDATKANTYQVGEPDSTGGEESETDGNESL